MYCTRSNKLLETSQYYYLPLYDVYQKILLLSVSMVGTIIVYCCTRVKYSYDMHDSVTRVKYRCEMCDSVARVKYQCEMCDSVTRVKYQCEM